MTEGLFLKIIENLINSVELRFLTIWSSSAKTKFSAYPDIYSENSSSSWIKIPVSGTCQKKIKILNW